MSTSSTGASAAAAPTVRKTLRVPVVTSERAEFWAQRLSDRTGGRISLNDFIVTAVENEIARLNGVVVDAENMMTGRMNQLADAVQSLSEEMEATRNIVQNSYAGLMRMAQGESILSDDLAAEAAEAAVGPGPLADDENGEQP